MKEIEGVVCPRNIKGGRKPRYEAVRQSTNIGKEEPR